MSHEMSPVANVIPVRCLVCNRILVDATSVEIGVGPECRENMGIPEGLVIGPMQVDAVLARLRGLEDRGFAERLEGLMAFGGRKAANALTYHMARLMQEGVAVPDAQVLAEVLGLLGYPTFAKRVQERLEGYKARAQKRAPKAKKPRVFIEATGDGTLTLVTPYDETFVGAIKAIPGRKWHAPAKAWTFPVAAKPAVWSLLQMHFAGVWAEGPKGTFQI
jgi:hypothetical protein